MSLRCAPPCPVPPRTAGGSLGSGAPLCFCPTPTPSCRRGTPSSLPCLLCPSALRPTRAHCGAIRVAAPSLCPLSLSWPLGPVLPPVCSPSLAPTCPPSQVPWSLALSVPALVFPLPSRHAFRGATRGAPLPLPPHLAAPWFPGSVCTAARGPLLPPYLPLPPLPLPLSILTCCPLAGHFVGMSHACRRFASVPSLPAPPFPPSSPRRILRRTLRRQVACTSQARTWPSSCDSTRGGPLRGNAPRRPALSIATAHCGRLARRWGTFELPPHARSFVPSWHAPCPALLSLPLCPPASTSTMRSNSRGSVPSLPSLSALAPWPRPAPRLLALPRPLVPPRSLGHWPSVSLSPSSLHPPCLHFAEQFARHPSHSPSTLPLPGALVPSAPARSLRPSSPALSPPPSPALFLLHTPQYTSQDTLLACRMHVAGTRLAPPSPPCPVLSLHYAGHSAEHCVDTSHACRRHAPGFYWRRRREGWLHAVTARRCRSPRGSRRRGQPLHMPRGARPW